MSSGVIHPLRCNPVHWLMCRSRSVNMCTKQVRAEVSPISSLRRDNDPCVKKRNKLCVVMFTACPSVLNKTELFYLFSKFSFTYLFLAYLAYMQSVDWSVDSVANKQFPSIPTECFEAPAEKKHLYGRKFSILIDNSFCETCLNEAVTFHTCVLRCVPCFVLLCMYTVKHPIQ